MRIPIGGSSDFGQVRVNLDRENVAIVLRTIEVGWADAQSRILPTDDEVAITERLRDAMYDALVAGRLSWGRIVFVQPGAESRSTRGVLRPDGRTDISFFFYALAGRLGDPEAHAVVECKRISDVSKPLARLYVDEGIERFRIGQYSGRHENGFMVGYVIAGSPSGAVGQINSVLAGRSQHGEMLRGNGSPTRFLSRHPRVSSAKPIILHHLALAV